MLFSFAKLASYFLPIALAFTLSNCAASKRLPEKGVEVTATITRSPYPVSDIDSANFTDHYDATMFETSQVKHNGKTVSLLGMNLIPFEEHIYCDREIDVLYLLIGNRSQHYVILVSTPSKTWIAELSSPRPFTFRPKFPTIDELNAAMDNKNPAIELLVVVPNKTYVEDELWDNLLHDTIILPKNYQRLKVQELSE